MYYKHNHGKGCLCEADDCRSLWCGCPWHVQEHDITSIPAYLYCCRVCDALVRDGEAHMRWHESRGDLG